MNRRFLLILLFALTLSKFSYAQLKTDWHNPQNNQYCIQNQGWNEDGINFKRFPLRAKSTIRSAVWNLSCQSAGLSIRFKSNSQNIKVRYQVTGGHSMPHMPATGVSGIDLYTIRNNEYLVCYGNYSFSDTIKFNYTIDKENLVNQYKEYELFLPLYNGVNWLEVGVDSNTEFEFIPAKQESGIVVYGTSIAQGACASRPGMAWSNILERKLNMPVINLGFSGNGKLESEVIDLIAELKARVYIIDCMANLNDIKADSIKVLVENAVKKIRENNKTPILLVEHAGYSNSFTNKEKYDSYKEANKGLKIAYQSLLKDKIKKIYYLSEKELNFDPDSWVDYVHPSDYGMVQQVESIIKKTKKILK